MFLLCLNELPFDVNNKLNLINLSIRGKTSFNVFVIFAVVCRDVQSKLLQLNFPVYKDTIFTKKIFFTLLHHIHVSNHFEYYSNIIEFSTTQERKLLTDVLYTMH